MPPPSASGSIREEKPPEPEFVDRLVDFSGPGDEEAEKELVALEKQVTVDSKKRAPKKKGQTERHTAASRAAEPASSAAKSAFMSVGQSGPVARATLADLRRPASDAARPEPARDKSPAKRCRSPSPEPDRKKSRHDKTVLSLDSRAGAGGLMDPSYDRQIPDRKKRSKKSRKNKKHKKSKDENSSDSTGDKKVHQDKKRKRRRSSSSSASSSPSSVFHGASRDPNGSTWAAMKERARLYLGYMAMKMAQRCADQVSRDGVRQDWVRREMPASMQVYYNRVLASDGFGGIPASQRRDSRESETLCVLMDQLALGRFQGDFFLAAFVSVLW